jgi:hypothetical protein
MPVPVMIPSLIARTDRRGERVRDRNRKIIPAPLGGVLLVEITVVTAIGAGIRGLAFGH